MDGYIKANSENVRGVTNWYSASGGSGGSIHINTVNYTGQGSDVISLIETIIHKFKTDKVGIGHEKIKV